MDILDRLDYIFHGSSHKETLNTEKRTSQLIEEAVKGLRIQPSEHSIRVLNAGTLGEAYQLQTELADILIPQIEEQQNSKYKHTYGEVFENMWELWHCYRILEVAVKELPKEQEKLKKEILKKTKEASDAFNKFNENVDNNQAEKERLKLAEKFIVALTALKLVNTQNLYDFEVDIHDYVKGDQLDYMNRGMRNS